MGFVIFGINKRQYVCKHPEAAAVTAKSKTGWPKLKKWGKVLHGKSFR